MDILEGDDGPLRELALFAGAGGGILGGLLLGWRTVCAVEFDQYAASVLVARQNDGCLEPFPVWDDVRTFDGTAWRGRVDVVSGGFPCTDISAAGKGAGIDGEQSGLWREMARIIGEVRPRFAFVENSPMLTSRGLGRVLGDLAELGYDARWGCVAAGDAIWLGGDPCLYHERNRIWIVAFDPDTDVPEGRRGKIKRSSRNGKPALHGEEGEDANPVRTVEQSRTGRRKVRQGGAKDAHCDSDGRPQVEREDEVAAKAAGFEHSIVQRGQRGRADHWWSTEPDVGRVVHGLANRVDRLRAIGNGQVPCVAALAWRILAKGGE